MCVCRQSIDNLTSEVNQLDKSITHLKKQVREVDKPDVTNQFTEFLNVSVYL